MENQLNVPEHPGQSCRAVRESRKQLSGGNSAFELKNIARRCKVGLRMLHYFEDGTKLLNEGDFNAYLEALQLPENEVNRLKKMSVSYTQRSYLESLLDFYDSSTIARERQLAVAFRILRELRTPAFIIDPLSCTPVINSSLAGLFNLDDIWLRKPVAWHGVGTKFHPGSPVRKAYKDTKNPYFNHAVHAFHESLDEYFYTRPSLALQQQLLQLSPEEYGKYWLASVMMVEPDWPESPIAVINYRKTESNWTIRLVGTYQLTSPDRQSIPYRLLTLMPESDEADSVLDDIERRIPQDLLYATDYGLSQSDLLYG